MSRPAVLLFLFCLAVALPESAAAETTEILTTGPDVARGLPYLSPNTLEYYEVTYRPASQDNAAGAVQGGEAGSATTLRVLYAASAVVPPPSWKRAPCGEPGVLTVAMNPDVLFYPDPGGFGLFFIFPSQYPQSCSFASAFLRRFSYFLGITQNSPLSSFPAVLQVP